MRDTFAKLLCDYAKEQSQIILITGDLGFKVFDEYRSLFPCQYINSGISEQNMTAVATGLALQGFTVFTYSIGNFPTLRCLEQIRNDVCYHNANVKIISVGSGFSYGPLGASHHSTEDISIMRSLPNLRIISPCCKLEVREAVKELLFNDGPYYMRLDKSYIEDGIVDKSYVNFGPVRIIEPGHDLLFFVTGGIAEEAIKASKKLKKKKISSNIVSVSSLKPLDADGIIDLCGKFSVIVTLEEHSKIGGLGTSILELLSDKKIYGKKVLRLGLPDNFTSLVGSQKHLRKVCNIDSDSIVSSVLSFLSYPI